MTLPPLDDWPYEGEEDMPLPFYMPTLVEGQNHPNHWYNRASDLHASAGAVWYAMRGSEGSVRKELGFDEDFSMGVACQPVYFMLCGWALEVVLKAILIKQGSASDQLKTHDVEHLLRFLGLSVTADEMRLLKFYEASAVWAGRYPLPVRPTDEKLQNHWELQADALTKEAGRVGNMVFRTYSDVTNWENFDKLWRSYAARF